MYDFFNVTKNYLCFSKIRNTLASKHEQIGVAGFSLAPRGWRVNRMGSLAISSPQKNRLSRGRFGRGRDTRNLFWCTLDRLKQPQNTALTFFFSLLRNVLVAQPLPRRKTTMSPLYHPFDPCNTFLVLDDFFGENEASARRIVLHTHTPSTVEHWNIQRCLFTLEFQWFGANSLLAMFAVVGQDWKSRSNWIFINLNHEKRRKGW